MIRIILSLFILFSSVEAICAQSISGPPMPDNAVTELDGVGLPPSAAKEGTAESVNLHNGALTMFIPALSLPQKAGMKPLILGFSYDSNQSRVREQVRVSVGPWGKEDGVSVAEFDTYVAPLSTTTTGIPFELNLPRLKGSLEYVGTQIIPPTDTTSGGYYNNYCLQNFTFTDWAGATHVFSSASVNCSVQNSTYGGSPGMNVVSYDVADDYKFDASNLKDLRVIAPDGEIFHFINPQLPCPGAEGGYCTIDQNDEDFLNKVADVVEDRNGNKITIGYSTITDSVGRTISYGPQSISYKDSNGLSQKVEFQSDTAPDPDTDYDVGPIMTTSSCAGTQTSVGPPPETQYTFYGTGGPGSPDDPVPALRYGLKLSFSGSGQTYHFVFDGFGHIVKVTYPSGGYHRYDYTAYSYAVRHWLSVCAWKAVQVHHRYECRNTSGSCGDSGDPEIVTTYTPGGTLANGTVGFDSSTGTNGSITVQNLDNTSTFHKLGNMYDPLHSDLLVVSIDADGNEYKRVTDNIDSLVTKLTSGNLSLSYRSTFKYKAPQISIGDRPLGFDPQVIEREDYDFDDTKIKTTTFTPYNNFTKNIIGGKGSQSSTDQVNQLTHLSENNYDTSGNLSSTSQSGKNATAQTTLFSNYDTYGRPKTVKDANDNATTYEYGSGWEDSICPVSQEAVNLTKITNTLGQSTSYTYYTCSGLLASITDANLKKTVYTYDGVGRRIGVVTADKGKISTSYSSTTPVSITQTQLADPQPSRGSLTTYDGVMNVAETASGTGLTNPDYIEKSYDSMGRIISVTNPHHASASIDYGVTTYRYDAQGRVKYVCNPGNSNSSSCSTGSSYTEHLYSIDAINKMVSEDIYDELRHHKLILSDAFGRTRFITEYADSGNATTEYHYDGFGNLTSVSQPGVSGEIKRIDRSFSYDGLSHLISSTNPETGTVTYSYNAMGNVQTRTDARGIITTYAYDKGNRITSKTYSGNAPSGSLSSCYKYDDAAVENGVGRLSAEWTTSRSCDAGPQDSDVTVHKYLSYNAVGRLLSEQECVLGHCSSSSPMKCPDGSTSGSYCYDLAGDLIQYRPGNDALVFMQNFDAAGRVVSVKSSASDSTHPSIIFSTDPVDGYLPGGRLHQWSLGNNLSISRTYDERLRLTDQNVKRQ